MGKSWFSSQGSKLSNVRNILTGLAAFRADSVQLPAGLEEIVLAEDFNFNRCITKIIMEAYLLFSSCPVCCLVPAAHSLNFRIAGCQVPSLGA